MSGRKKSVLKKIWLWMLTIGIFIFGIVVYYIHSTNTELLFVEWMAVKLNIETIFKGKQEFNTRSIRLFWYIWIFLFSVSIYQLGKLYFKKEKTISKRAILKDKEPYLKAQGIYYKLKQIKEKNNLREIDNIIYEIKIIEEHLCWESNFGYGNDSITKCENVISNNLKQLEDAIEYLKRGITRERINIIYDLILEINLQLEKRQELEKIVISRGN